MAFGLMNGTAYFSKAIHQALRPLRESSRSGPPLGRGGAGGNVVLYYLDDILIPGKSWNELKEKLRLVFEALRRAGLTIKLEKCQFLYQRVTYLGHILSENGIEPGTHKVAAIRDFPVPRNAHGVQRYLGLTSYFRKFVPHFAQLVTPLNELSKSNITYE